MKTITVSATRQSVEQREKNSPIKCFHVRVYMRKTSDLRQPADDITSKIASKAKMHVQLGAIVCPADLDSQQTLKTAIELYATKNKATVNGLK